MTAPSARAEFWIGFLAKPILSVVITPSKKTDGGNDFSSESNPLSHASGSKHNWLSAGLYLAALTEKAISRGHAQPRSAALDRW